MFNIRKETVERLRKEYPVGCRVELTRMNDPYRTDLVPGCRGTVIGVDDAGSIHVNWDIHSSLAVIYGEDACKRLDSVTTMCYNTKKEWDERTQAIQFFKQAYECSEGSEQARYSRILIQLYDGETYCTDEV